MEGIQVSTQTAGSQNQVSVIKVGGFIDTTTSSEVERALNSLLKQNRFNVIIDLGNVDYISSAGWGIFISEIKSIREHNGDLKLVKMIPDVYEIFELLEFHHILDVYESVNEAVQKFEETTVQRPEKAQVAQETISTSSAGATIDPQSQVHPPQTDRQSFGQSMASGREAAKQEDKHETKSVPIEMQSLEDKVKYIVAHYPHLGAYKINKILNTEKFGFTKVGWFGVRSLLNRIGLNSRKNRQSLAQKYFQEEN
jgi:anti-sigma B factor antagonist